MLSETLSKFEPVNDKDQALLYDIHLQGSTAPLSNIAASAIAAAKAEALP